MSQTKLSEVSALAQTLCGELQDIADGFERCIIHAGSSPEIAKIRLLHARDAVQAWKDYLEAAAPPQDEDAALRALVERLKLGDHVTLNGYRRRVLFIHNAITFFDADDPGMAASASYIPSSLS